MGKKKEKLGLEGLNFIERLIANTILNRIKNYIDMKSWKTTLTGVALLVGAIATALIALLDGDPATVVNFEAILAALAGLGLMAARDNNVTSEDAGAK